MTPVSARQISGRRPEEEGGEEAGPAIVGVADFNVRTGVTTLISVCSILHCPLLPTLAVLQTALSIHLPPDTLRVLEETSWEGRLLTGH